MSLTIEGVVSKYIDENYPKGYDIEIDSGYELPSETLKLILNASSQEKIQEIISDEEMEYFSSSYDEALDHVTDEIIDNLEELLNEDRDDIYDIVSSQLQINTPSILSSTTLQANVYPLNKRGERFYFTDKENIEEINLGELEENSYGKNLLDSMALLKVNPYEVGEILKEREDIIINNFPKIEYEDGVDGKDFFEEFDNSSYGGSLMFTTSIGLEEYVENFETFKERGVLIPSGTQVGFIDSYNGSCGFIGLKTATDIEIKDFEIKDDRAIEYGLDKIAGVVKSYYWGSSKLSFPKTDLEKELIGKVDSILNSNSFKTPHLIKDDTLKVVSYFINDLARDLKSKPFNENILNVDEKKAKFEKYYWIKEKPEVLENAMQIITNVAEGLKNKNVDELMDFIDNYTYSLEDFKSPIQKQLIAINEFSKGLNEKLAETFERILIDDRNKNNLEEILIKNLDSFKTHFLSYDKSIEEDKRFSSREKADFSFYSKEAIKLIDNKKDDVLEKLNNDSFVPKDATQIVSDLSDLLDENNYLVNNFKEKSGKESPSQAKKKRDR
jgi:hypothetical protein